MALEMLDRVIAQLDPEFLDIGQAVLIKSKWLGEDTNDPDIMMALSGKLGYVVDRVRVNNFIFVYKVVVETGVKWTNPYLCYIDGRALTRVNSAARTQTRIVKDQSSTSIHTHTSEGKEHYLLTIPPVAVVKWEVDIEDEHATIRVLYEQRKNDHKDTWLIIMKHAREHRL